MHKLASAQQHSRALSDLHSWLPSCWIAHPFNVTNFHIAATPPLAPCRQGQGAGRGGAAAPGGGAAVAGPGRRRRRVGRRGRGGAAPRGRAARHAAPAAALAAGRGGGAAAAGAASMTLVPELHCEALITCLTGAALPCSKWNTLHQACSTVHGAGHVRNMRFVLAAGRRHSHAELCDQNDSAHTALCYCEAMADDQRPLQHPDMGLAAAARGCMRRWRAAAAAVADAALAGAPPAAAELIELLRDAKSAAACLAEPLSHPGALAAADAAAPAQPSTAAACEGAAGAHAKSAPCLTAEAGAEAPAEALGGLPGCAAAPRVAPTTAAGRGPMLAPAEGRAQGAPHMGRAVTPQRAQLPGGEQLAWDPLRASSTGAVHTAAHAAVLAAGAPARPPGAPAGADKRGGSPVANASVWAGPNGDCCEGVTGSALTGHAVGAHGAGSPPNGWAGGAVVAENGSCDGDSGQLLH